MWCYQKHYIIHVYVSRSSYFMVLQEEISGCIVNLWSRIHSCCFVSVWGCLTYEFAAWTEVQGEQSVRLMINNKPSISLAKSLIFHKRGKYIDPKYHFLCNQVQNGQFEVVHVSTQKQFADVLSKTIKTEHFINLRDVIGVVDF